MESRLSEIDIKHLLELAVYKNDETKLEFLLSSGADVNVKYKNNKSLLHKATLCNSGVSHQKVIEMLVKNGANVNSVEKDGSRPIHYLVEKKTPEIVKSFLKFKPKLEVCNERGETPLLQAIRDKNTEIVQLLVEHGCNVSYEKNNSTPLHKAAFYNKLSSHQEIIEILLRNGANANNSQDGSGKTPLHYLVCRYNMNAIKVLLNFNADVNIVDKCGRIPLADAAQLGNVEIIRLLVDHGSLLNV